MDKQKIKKNIIIIFFLLMMMVVAFVSSEGFWKKSGNSIQLVLNNSYYLNLTSSIGYINNYPICTSGNNYCNLTSSQYNLTYNHTTATYNNYNPIWSSTDNTSKVNLNSTYYNLLLYGYNQSSDEISLWYKYDNDRITPKNNYSLYIAHNLFFNYNSSFIWYQNWTWYDVNYTYNSTTETTMNDFLNGIINYLNITRQSGNITLNTNQNNLQDTLLLMHFDDNFTLNTNLTDDVSIYNNNVVCVNNTFCPVFNSSGYIGGAFEFDGVNDYFILSNSPPMLSSGITSGVTISAWFKPKHVVSGDKRIVHFWNSYMISLTSGDDLIACLSNATKNIGSQCEVDEPGYIRVNNTVSANNWYHVVLTGKSPNTTNLYLNGVLIGESSSNVMPIIRMDQFDIVIGARSFSLSDFFNGSIDEVGIWNRTLTAEEILRDYQAGLKKLQPSLNDFEHNGTYNSQVFDLGNNANASQISFGYDVPKTSYYYPANLVFYWDGSVNYSLVNTSIQGTANGGVIIGGTGNTSGGHVIDRNATVFDGVNDYISIASSPVFNYYWYKGGAISLWFKTSNYNQIWGYMVHAGANPELSNAVNFIALNGSKVYGAMGRFDLGGATYTLTDLTPDIWHHAVITGYASGGGTLSVSSLYVDGIWRATTSGATNIIITNTAFQIGRYNASKIFNGTIDEVAIWSRTLSSDEINAMYNASSKGNLKLQTKVSNNITLTEANWSDYYIANGSVQNLVNLTSPYRYLQYRALFDTLDTNVTPVLTDVNFTWIANTSNITIINNYTWQQTLNVSRIYSQQGFLYIEDPTDNSRICTQGNGMCINGTGTSTFLPLWNSIKQLTNSIISQLGNWINIAGNLNVAGNINATNITIAGNTGISRTIQVVNYTNLVVVQYCNMTFTGGILTSSNC